MRKEIEMDQNPISKLLRLKVEDIVEIDDGRGVSVKALTGVVWLTQARDGRDIVLHPGDAFTLDRRGTAILSALQPATVSIASASSRPIRIASSGVQPLNSAA
jgi:hypothetical protein